jgi:zinc/manganese transport system substrate-binding protein
MPGERIRPVSKVSQPPSVDRCFSKLKSLCKLPRVNVISSPTPQGLRRGKPYDFLRAICQGAPKRNGGGPPDFFSRSEFQQPVYTARRCRVDSVAARQLNFQVNELLCCCKQIANNSDSPVKFTSRFFLSAFLFSNLTVLSLHAEDKLAIASFSTILTEIAEKVGGQDVAVTGLVKPGEDPHEYQLSPSALQTVTGARLVLTSGKNLEHYFNDLRGATQGDVLPVGDKLPSLKKPAGESEEEAKSGFVEDPHWWNSVPNVEKATLIVRDELIKLDPTHANDYRANAQAYANQLHQLNAWAKQKIAELPRDQRKLVTSHDAFQYFAKEYGFKIYSIEGLSTEDEPSLRHVSDLIDLIRKQHVKAIFLESTLNPKVSGEITRESGAKIGGTLYADGLGTGDGITYEGMIKHNVATIVDALK